MVFRAVEFFSCSVYVKHNKKKFDVLNMSKSSCTLRHYFTFCNWWNALSCALHSVAYRKEIARKTDGGTAFQMSSVLSANIIVITSFFTRQTPDRLWGPPGSFPTGKVVEA
jgi:hypothetical protein